MRRREKVIFLEGSRELVGGENKPFKKTNTHLRASSLNTNAK
jgi:hypothetical protein